MTCLFTIHINRVDRRRSGGETGGYTRGGPLHLACNAYVVTAMCHSCRASAARAIARIMNIYPRLLQNKCQYRGTRGERATKRNEELRNPGATSTFCPWTLLGESRLRLHDIDKRIKISSDPPATTVDMTTTVVVGPAHFPESSGYIYFHRPETPVHLCPCCSTSGIQSAFIHFRFRMKNLAAMITASEWSSIAQGYVCAWKGFHIENRSRNDIHRKLFPVLVSKQDSSIELTGVCRSRENFATIHISWKFFNN